MSTLFGRKASLIVEANGQGIDLSELHFIFEVRQSDVSTPNNAYFKIFNLAPETASRIEREFTSIYLQAGYDGDGPFGIIFKGTIAQVFKGRDRNVDSFCEIFAVDGDTFHNVATINTSIAAGATRKQVFETICNQAKIDGKAATDIYPFSVDTAKQLGGISPLPLSRGKVMYGMARSYVRDWAEKNGFRWSIQNGEIVLVPVTGYRPGEAVKLSPQTGLVGIPEATNDGVHVRCLMNPMIRIGCLVQIAQDDISTLTVKSIPDATLLLGDIPSAAITTRDGFYRVMVAEFSGDTRGQQWYVDLVALSVDVTQPADQSVKDGYATNRAGK